MRTLQHLVCENIWKLPPYGSARDGYHGGEPPVWLDANENPYNKPFNRYPTAQQQELREEISAVKNVPAGNIFLSNGSDEAIDLVYRIFCRPETDNVVAIEPTYGMYKVFSDINNVEYRPVLLDKQYRLDATRLLDACDKDTKVIWLCSPNNPTGNNLHPGEIEKILTAFDGIVVIDEAYSDFSPAEVFRTQIIRYPRLIVLNTMSSAWGCAGLRLGMVFASEEIIKIFEKVRHPRNINQLTQQQALATLKQRTDVEKWVKMLIQERIHLMKAFSILPICEQVYPSDANFFLAKMTDADSVYQYLIDNGLVVSNCTGVQLCHNCLRVTIGTKGENTKLLSALRQYK